jgi:hypothetical protein
MADLVNVAPANCRLQVDSTSQLSLQRFKGAYIPLKIAGEWEAKLIPSTVPTLANTGLTAATLYYIYAFDDSGTLTLEASTTAHATDADTGVEIKSGDASRTLVGKVFLDAGTPGTFVNSITKRWCLNWFNRRGLDMLGVFTTSRSGVGNPYAEVHSEIRIQFLAWADEVTLISATGAYRNGAFVNSDVGLAIDSTTVPSATVGGIHRVDAVMNFGMTVVVALSATVNHFATIISGNQGGGNVQTFSATAAGGDPNKTWLYGLVRG